MKPFGVLENAKELSQQRFYDADVLDKGVDNIPGLQGKKWYEEVTPEGLCATKQATVSGYE